jgi:hypothetical protein
LIGLEKKVFFLFEEIVSAFKTNSSDCMSIYTRRDKSSQYHTFKANNKKDRLIWAGEEQNIFICLSSYYYTTKNKGCYQRIFLYN